MNGAGDNQHCLCGSSLGLGHFKSLALNWIDCYAVALGLEATNPEVHNIANNLRPVLSCKCAHKNDEVQITQADFAQPHILIGSLSDNI